MTFISCTGSGLRLALRRAARAAGALTHVAVEGVELQRTIYLYGVAGRQRTAVALVLMKMMRADDWMRIRRPGRGRRARP